MKAFSNSIFLVLSMSLLFVLMPGKADAQNRRNQQRAQQLTTQGDQLFRQQNYDGAIEKYAQAIALAPNQPNPRFWKGMAHYRLQNFDMALPELSAALDSGYNRPLDAYSIRWRIYFARKEFDSALSDVRAGLQLDPNNQDLLLALGDISFGRGDYQAAVDAYTGYSRRNAANAEVYFQLARSHAGLGNVDEMIAAAEESIRKGTRSIADAHLMIGDGYTAKMQYAQAVASYERALNARSDQPETYQKLAEGYRAQADFEKAIETLRRALRQFPNDGGLYTDISWYYSLADRTQDAVDAAQAAVRYSPENHMGYTNLCRAYNELRRYDLAVSSCNSALRIKPDDGETNFYLSRATRAQGRTAEANRLTKRAVAGLEESVRLNPAYSDMHYLLGGAYYDDGQMQRSMASYKRSLELSPNFVKALFNVGIMYVADGKKSDAQEYHRRLVPLSQKYADMLKAEIDRM